MGIDRDTFASPVAGFLVPLESQTLFLYVCSVLPQDEIVPTAVFATAASAGLTRVFRYQNLVGYKMVEAEVVATSRMSD